MATLPPVRRLSALFGTNERFETLRVGAQVYVNFLSLTRRQGWLQGHISKQHDSAPQTAIDARQALLTASKRYLAFADIRANDATAVPTRDISVVWSADLLRPQVGAILGYEEDAASATAWFDHQQIRLLQSGALFEQATGKQWSITSALNGAAIGGGIGAVVTKHPVGLAAGAVIGAATNARVEEHGVVTTPAIRRFDADGSGITSAAERAAALQEWQRRYNATADEWQRLYKSEYRVQPGQMAVQAPADVGEPVANEVANQLADAVASQASFVGRILALGPRVVNDAWIGRAVTRYAQFLAMCKEHPGTVHVPKADESRRAAAALDIDLIWHVHMLSPLDYRDDCHEARLLGRLLSHDDQMEEATLSTAFADTKQRWHESTGTPYVWTTPANTGYGYSGCGSCGWGNDDFHTSLEHRTQEADMVADAYGTTARSTDVAGKMLEPTLEEAWAQPWAAEQVTSSDSSSSFSSSEMLVDPWAPPPAAEGSGDGGGSWGWGGDGGSGDGDAGGCGSGCGGGD